MKTIHGLNSSYNAIVLNVENSTTELTFAQLRSRLLIYEERLAQISESPSESTLISTMNVITSSTMAPLVRYAEKEVIMLQNVIGDIPLPQQTNNTNHDPKIIC